MPEQISTSHPTPTTVNLVRSDHSWTEADSAAGFVLRYLNPMRSQLIKALGSEKEADHALKLLLTHLVSAGFGEHRKGRLRDFLSRAVRSCAKARLSELGQLESGQERMAEITPEAKMWLVGWRDCLLERAWRSLERMEHMDRTNPLYSVLWIRTTNPKCSPDELISAVEKHSGTTLAVGSLEKLQLQAKASFAQLLADEVVETLEKADKASVKKEIQLLGMAGAFSGLDV